MDDVRLLGQLITCGVRGPTVDDGLRALVRECKIGNFILFARNVRNADQLRALTDELRALALAETGAPPLISVDQEGGMVSRLPPPATQLPGAMALGAVNAPAITRDSARAMGEELRAVGFTFDNAPDADVNTNPRNPVIGARSFGDDPRRVGEQVAAFTRGLRESGVAACLKHFPGHGDTAVDSHVGLPRVDKTVAELEAAELVPFRAGIEAGADAVMTSHILFPRIEPEPVPATMSRAILTGLLRERLGFTGVVATDCLEMDAIKARYGVAEGALGALRAGADLVTISHTYELAREASLRLQRALAEGDLSRDALLASAGRIAALKERLADAPVPALDCLGCEAHRRLADGLADATLCELARDARPLPPVTADAFFISPPCRVLTGVGEGESEPLSFARYMGAAFGAACETCSPDPDDAEIARLLAAAEGRGTVAVGLYNAQFQPGQLRLTEALCRAGHAVIAVALRTPYELTSVPAQAHCVAAFEYTTRALDALQRYLRQSISARGTWPVRL